MEIDTNKSFWSKAKHNSQSKNGEEQLDNNDIWTNLPASPVRFSENVADLYQDYWSNSNVGSGKTSRAKKISTTDITAKALSVLSAKVVR